MALKTEGRFKIEVVADNTGTWCSNAIRFDTVPEAEAYARDLASRWLLVRKWRVFDCFTEEPGEEKWA